jgi:hypothetical protein
MERRTLGNTAPGGNELRRAGVHEVEEPIDGVGGRGVEVEVEI